MTKTNDLSVDIGYVSINHYGEELCGDHIEVTATQDSNATVIVLADGLGSGVKASILSTLTSKIIATMTAAGMSLSDTVETIAATLPVCSVRGIAYSTFTVIRVTDTGRAEVFQYDNPPVIFMRDGKNLELDFTTMNISGKEIRCSEVQLHENDVFIAFSDGVEHAGVGLSYNFGWKRENIIDFMETFTEVGFTSKTLAKILLDETERLYASRPGDDASVCAVKIRRRVPVNLVIGPPSDPADCNKMMSLFFAKDGKHIVCGGTTSSIAARYLKKELVPLLTYLDPDIPPTASLEGADLVTEGVITINRVLEYARDYLKDNSSYEKWGYKQDGASKIARLLFEEATDINFFVGKAVNPAHQSADLPINFTIKMRLVDELSACLADMGKKIKVSYF